jgi:hypothetical protein
MIVGEAIRGIVYDAERRRDPTGSMDLRRRLKTYSRKAIATWTNAIREAIVQGDMLGLKGYHSQTWLPHQALTAFTAFARAAGYDAFNQITLETDRSIAEAYKRGHRTAAEELDVDPMDTRAQVGLYTGTATSDVRAIVEAVTGMMVRAVSQGIASRDTPHKVMKQLQQNLQHVGVRRLETMAETAITTAYNAGKLDLYQNQNLATVGVIAETQRTLQIASPEEPDEEGEVAPTKVKPKKEAGGLFSTFAVAAASAAAAAMVAGALSSRRQAEEVTSPGDVPPELEPEPVRSTPVPAITEPPQPKPRVTEIPSTTPAAQVFKLAGSNARMVTILTAGDDRVCDECDSLEGLTFTIEEARRLIPVHPNCRCVFVPTNDKRFAPVPREEDDVEE